MLFGDFGAGGTLPVRPFHYARPEFRRGAMRCNIWFAVMAGLVAGAAAVAPARADGTEPVIVIPGRPGVPVMVYSRDISCALVAGALGIVPPGIFGPGLVA